MRDFHLIYDGDCGLCVKTMRVFAALDVRRRLAFHDARRRSAVLAEFPQLRDAALDEAMFAVRGATVTSGFDAFRELVWQSPLTWILLPLFYAPGAHAIGPRVYRWIANRRRRFGCGESCSLPVQ